MWCAEVSISMAPAVLSLQNAVICAPTPIRIGVIQFTVTVNFSDSCPLLLQQFVLGRNHKGTTRNNMVMLIVTNSSL